MAIFNFMRLSKKSGKITQYQDRVIFLGPAIISIFILNIIPMCMSFNFSFSRWNLLGPIQFVGLQNYQHIFTDPLFWQTLFNTLIFAIGSVSLEVICALFLAYGLSRLTKGIKLFETLYFLPVITPMVAVALVWGWMLDPGNGMLNQWMQYVGLPKVAWLYEPGWAMFWVIILRAWKEMGYSTLLLWTALKALPQDIFEAAKLDGATPQQQFFKITIPQLSPILYFVITISTIGAFQAFDSIYLLTQGGPNNTTQVLVYWIFKNAFSFYKIGEASAIAYILLLFIAGLTLLQWQLKQKVANI